MTVDVTVFDIFQHFTEQPAACPLSLNPLFVNTIQTNVRYGIFTYKTLSNSNVTRTCEHMRLKCQHNHRSNIKLTAHATIFINSNKHLSPAACLLERSDSSTLFLFLSSFFLICLSLTQLTYLYTIFRALLISAAVISSAPSATIIHVKTKNIQPIELKNETADHDAVTVFFFIIIISQ